MKTSINFKLYKNGTEFLADNCEVLHQNIYIKMQTAFFEGNAKLYHSFDKDNYAFSFSENTKKLLFLRCSPFNALLYGDIELALDAAEIIADYGVNVEHILGEQKLVECFLKFYQQRIEGTIELEHSMSIMVLEKLNGFDSTEVTQCSSNDLENLAAYYRAFHSEIFHQDSNLAQVKEVLRGKEQNFYAYKVGEKIVSIACKTREAQDICAISHVYTAKEHRGKGYSKRVVSKICQELLKENKIPYLFVDNQNPISNHLYLNLGFQYLINQSQYYFKRKE